MGLRPTPRISAGTLREPKAHGAGLNYNIHRNDDGLHAAGEDETDLDKIQLDLSLYEIYSRGFVSACGAMEEAELMSLPLGAKLMTLECGLRFLTDYLEGDHYFAVARPTHNLDRTRTQMKLVREMERHWDAMMDIVGRCRT